MSFHASANTQRLEHGLWRALTRLDGFEFPQEPLLTGVDLKNFEKVMLGKSSWRHLTEATLAARVAVIFEAACNVFENENYPASTGLFYMRVAKKVTRTRLKDYTIFHQIIDTYVGGLKKVATRSENHVYVDRRSAPAALSVASWIDLTEDQCISITTKGSMNINNSTPPQQQSRKRRAEVLEDGRKDREAEARGIQLKKAISERDQALRELGEAKTQIHSLTQEIEATKFRCDNQEVQLRDAKREVKRKTSEWRRAQVKQEKFLKAFKASQRDREEAIANLERQYDDRDSKYFTQAETRWKDATRDLTLAKRERDQSQRALADCARVIKSLNSKLNGENGGA
ncbi:hypothetical protein F5Y12DRAFT_791658 [Xylaria sp. FL1777]|nr:hypothetical protein F5Y12DRAFT_791658 [Xylaria sp. FL1777]